MPSITLKDVPEELLVRLRRVAGSARRSLNQQALILIEGGLDGAETAEERAERQIDAWRRLAGTWQSNETFEEEVAAIYTARTPGRDIDL